MDRYNHIYADEVSTILGMNDSGCWSRLFDKKVGLVGIKEDELELLNYKQLIIEQSFKFLLSGCSPNHVQQTSGLSGDKNTKEEEKGGGKVDI